MRSEESDSFHIAVVAALKDVGEEGIRLTPLKDQTLEKVRAAATRDPEYQALREAITNGFPEYCHDLEPHLRPYWGVLSLFALDDDLIVYEPRLLIPCNLRREILLRLHDSPRDTSYKTSGSTNHILSRESVPQSIYTAKALAEHSIRASFEPRHELATFLW